MKRHRLVNYRTHLLWLVMLFCGIHYCYTQTNENLKDSVIRLDEIMVIGYATGSLSTISGAVDKIENIDMNKGLLISPLDAIRAAPRE